MSSYVSAQEFKTVLKSKPLSDTVREFFFEGVPYVFRNNANHFDFLKTHLGSALGVSPDRIFVVGSAKLGFSASPHTFPRAFSDSSDIDVFVYSEEMFDEIWFSFLRWHYPFRYTGLYDADKSLASARKKDVYWGWFRPDQFQFSRDFPLPQSLKPVKTFSTKWFNTFKGLGNFPPFRHREITGRLYRTMDHALFYYCEGLRQLRDEASKR